MKKPVCLLLMAIMFSLVFTACSSDEDAMAPMELEIHDSYADVVSVKDGTAKLFMQGVISNKSKLKTAEMTDLPQLTMDGEVLEATYDPLYDDSKSEGVPPGESICYEISYEFDPGVDHEWKFKSADDTVVSGLDEYVCIKEALRNYEGKPQVTSEDLKKVEQEQKEKYKKFLEEEKQDE